MDNDRFGKQLLDLERRAVLPVKWGLFLVCLTMAVLTSPYFVPSPGLYACLMVFACSNAIFTYALLRIPEVVRYIRWYSGISYAADVLIICAITFVTGGIASDYYILFFLVIFRGAGIFPTVRSTLIADAAATAVYMGTVVLAHGSAAVLIERGFGTRFAMILGVVLLGWLFVHMITRQKDDYQRAFHELRVQSEFVGNIVRSMSEGVIAVDGRGRIRLLNTAARRILGLDERNWEGEEVYTASRELARALEHARHRQGQPSEVTLRLGADSGRTTEILVSAQTMESLASSEEEPGVVCVFRDMSDVRRLEAGLIRSEKLASVGELAAGLAHELGNPLSIIKSCADYLGGVLAGNADAGEELGIIGAEVNRCRTIVDQLLTLSRPVGDDRAVLDLCPVLRNTCELVRLQKGADQVSVADEIGNEPLMVLASASELTSVFTNLLVNAVQAMDGAGTITVRTGFEGDGRQQLGVVEIADTGCGIPPDQLEQIFEPFFTRREGGTGLGLAIVARILDQLGAAAHVTSELGQGTTFRLVFPLARRRRHKESDGAGESSQPARPAPETS